MFLSRNLFTTYVCCYIENHHFAPIINTSSSIINYDNNHKNLIVLPKTVFIVDSVVLSDHLLSIQPFKFPPPNFMRTKNNRPSATKTRFQFRHWLMLFLRLPDPFCSKVQENKTSCATCTSTFAWLSTESIKFTGSPHCLFSEVEGLSRSTLATTNWTWRLGPVSSCYASVRLNQNLSAHVNGMHDFYACFLFSEYLGNGCSWVTPAREILFGMDSVNALLIILCLFNLIL